MIKRFPFPKAKRIQTLIRFNKIRDQEFLKKIDFVDLSIEELKSLKSDDLRYLYKKQIDKFQKYYLQTQNRPVDEKITYFLECEMKSLTKALKKFRNQCDKNNLSLFEFDSECVKFITDKNKRFIFKSKTAQRLYKIKNTVIPSSFGYWGYKAVTHMGSVNPWGLKRELLRSLIPIAFFTGVTCKFWSYITRPIPTVSKTFNLISIVALSPIWLLEAGINKLMSNVYHKFDQTPIPLNIIGEIHSGHGLTWRQFKPTYCLVRELTDDWVYSNFIDS